MWITLINIWRLPLLDADWCAFCQGIYKGIEGRECEELYHHYRDMSKAAGAKGAEGYEGSQRQRGTNSMTQPAKKTLREGNRETGVVEEHLKVPITALDKALK